MKKLLVVIVVLCLLAAAGAVGLHFYAQMKAVEAVEAYINGMPDLENGSHGKVAYSLLSKKLTVDDMKLTFKREDMKNMEIGNIEISKPDMGTFEAMMKGEGQEGVLNKLADTVTVSNIKAYDKKVSMSLGNYTITGPQVGKLPFKPSTPPEQAFAKENIPKLMKAVALDKAEMNDLVVKDLAEGKEVVKLKKISVENVHAGKIGAFIMEGMNIDADEEAQVKFQSISAKNLDYSNAIEMLSKDTPPDPFSMDSPVTYDEIMVKGIEVDAPKAQNVKVSEISLSNYKNMGAIPISFTFDLKGLSLDVQNIDDPKAQATFKQLGYDKLNMHMNLDYGWDADTNVLNLKNLSVKIDEMAGLTAKLTVEGVDLKKMKSPADAMMLLGGMLFKKAEIKYVDASLAPKMLKFAAAAQGMDPEQLRGMLISQVDFIKPMLGNTASADQIAKSAVVFIKDPRSLTIIAEPQAPLPVMVLANQAQMAPDKLIASLNISIAVNDGAPVKVEPAAMPSQPGAAQPQPAPAQPEPSQPAAPQPAPAQPQPSQPAPAPQPAAPEQPKTIGDMFKKMDPSKTDEGGEMKAQPLN